MVSRCIYARRILRCGLNELGNSRKGITEKLLFQPHRASWSKRHLLRSTGNECQCEIVVPHNWSSTRIFDYPLRSLHHFRVFHSEIGRQSSVPTNLQLRLSPFSRRPRLHDSVDGFRCNAWQKGLEDSGNIDCDGDGRAWSVALRPLQECLLVWLATHYRGH